ncbi:MAG TPA: ATP-binding protein, partial [Gemmataceae bacterium]|nr:ATP-binding protein [Gemmataceae bacterium]
VTRWNRWLEQRSGMAVADVVGRPLFEVFPDLVARRMERYYRQALTGQTVILSQRFHKYVIPLPPTMDVAGQSHLHQTSRIVPLLDGSAVCGTLTLIEDVTERVAYEAELRARARQQAVVAAAARSALSGREPADLAREVIGHTREVLDVDFAEVLTLSPGGESWAALAQGGWAGQASPSETPPRTRHVLSQGGAGEVVPLAQAEVAADPHLRSHGVESGLLAPVPGPTKLIGVLGIYTRYPRQFSPGEVLFVQALADVLGVAAERNRLEGELHLRVRDLAEGDRRKDEFLAMLAHELRNPLAPVRNGLQVLQAKSADPEVDHLTEMMGRQVNQIVRLVDDLLEVSRITLGKVSLRREHIDLTSVVHQAIEAARPLIESRRHELAVATPPESIHLDADSARLAQVIGNLLNNAAKYTEEAGRIWLTVRREGHEAVVSVRDTGVGISADMLPQVFDLFTQVDRTLDRSQGGLGIGLTLVRKLVELHGGSVQAFSAGPGRGSEFVIRLPGARGGVRFAADVATVPKRAEAVRAQRILIVDDNVDAAESLAMLLELKGHQVWTASSGPAAVEVALTHRPRLVLLDIGLPGMDGFEVARRLRQEPTLSGLTLVALTGYGQDDDRRRTKEAGFDYHLVKPADSALLETILAAVG